MSNPLNKTTLSLLFLSAFLFLRVANAHSFSHFSGDEDGTHCELCEIITTSQELTPFTGQVASETENQEVNFVKAHELNSGYEAPLHCIVYPTTVHNKPPPALSVLY